MEYKGKVQAPRLRPEFIETVLESEKSGGTRYHDAHEAMSDICK